MALNKRQRDWVKDRDGGCQYPMIRKGVLGVCGYTRYLEVHHLLPQRYCLDNGVDPDFPENLITLCRLHHRGSLNSVHPDAFEALQEYRKGNTDSFKSMSEARDQLLINGEVYWNDKYDLFFRRTALKNTRKYERDNPFPKNGHRR